MSRQILCRVLLAIVCIVSLLVLPSILVAQGNSEEAFQRVKEVQERHAERLMAIHGVEGTAVGLDDDDQPAVKVFLDRDGIAGVPKKLDGVPVHAVVTGKFYAMPKPAGSKSLKPTDSWPRPVPIGVSTGNEGKCSAGTIGCRVKDMAGKLYALSNNHVYALQNQAPIGSLVLQPGLYDSRCAFDNESVIGSLSKYVRIYFGGGMNFVDAAIAAVIIDAGTPRVGNATPANGYGTPSATTVSAYVGQAVQKYGRTTGLTKANVYATNWYGNVSYAGGTAFFVNQIMIGPARFSAAGDSGSLIVTQTDKYPVGLLFAGSTSYTIANPIDFVLISLGAGVTIDGE